MSRSDKSSWVRETSDGRLFGSRSCVTLEGSGGGGIVFRLLDEDGRDESGKEPLAELMGQDGA